MAHKIKKKKKSKAKGHYRKYQISNTAQGILKIIDGTGKKLEENKR